MKKKLIVLGVIAVIGFALGYLITIAIGKGV